MFQPVELDALIDEMDVYYSLYTKSACAFASPSSSCA